MDGLPAALVVEILSRLGDSTDLARCRLASRTLRELSLDVHRVAFRCSRDRFLRSRDPATRAAVPPFRSLIPNLISLLSGGLESLSMTVERPFVDNTAWEDDQFEDAEDLHLTGVKFLNEWMPVAGARLQSLAISDYWIQSCWRRSEALAVISECCCNLRDLDVRNAWLSVDGLKPMLKLTTLKLEFIRLDDEDLDKLNSCFPYLQVLSLIGVGGLREPKILLSELKTCNWTVSNFPLSLTIDAPNLVALNLKCVEPKFLVLKAPLLYHLNLAIQKPNGAIRMEKFHTLKSLKMVTSDLHTLVQIFQGSRTVNKLELEAPERSKSVELLDTITFDDLMTAFPNINDLTLGQGVCVQLERSFDSKHFGIAYDCNVLKKLALELSSVDVDSSFISCVLNLCAPACEVSLFSHGDTPAVCKDHLMFTLASNFPKVRWIWGTKSKSDGTLEI